jgi:AraC-like DNA-binding protein
MLVKEVAASVGFEDPFHFSHAFKNVFGASPDVFRRSRGQEQGFPEGHQMSHLAAR